MFRLPMVIIYMMIAFNITAFTLLLQFDWLIFHSIFAKIAAWACTIGAWWWSYVKRDQFVTLF